MTRASSGIVAKKRRAKILKLAKGYRGRNKNCLRIAKERVEKGLQYAYRDRRNKKRDFRKLWITRINAAARINDISYSRLMDGLRKAGILIDRKILSQIAIENPEQFTELANSAKKSMEIVYKASK